MREIPKCRTLYLCFAILLASHAGAIEPPGKDNERDDVRAAMNAQMKRLYEAEQAPESLSKATDVAPDRVNQDGGGEDFTRKMEQPTKDDPIHNRDFGDGVDVRVDVHTADSVHGPGRKSLETHQAAARVKLKKCLAELARLNIQRQSLEKAIEELSFDVRNEEAEQRRVEAINSVMNRSDRLEKSAPASKSQMDALYPPRVATLGQSNQRLKYLLNRAANLKAASGFLKAADEHNAAAKYMKMAEDAEQEVKQVLEKFNFMPGIPKTREPDIDRSAIDDLRAEIRSLRKEVQDLRSRVGKN